MVLAIFPPYGIISFKLSRAIFPLSEQFSSDPRCFQTIPEGLGVLVIVSVDDTAVQQVVDLVHLLTVPEGARLDEKKEESFKGMITEYILQNLPYRHFNQHALKSHKSDKTYSLRFCPCIPERASIKSWKWDKNGCFLYTPEEKRSQNKQNAYLK